MLSRSADQAQRRLIHQVSSHRQLAQLGSVHFHNVAAHAVCTQMLEVGALIFLMCCRQQPRRWQGQGQCRLAVSPSDASLQREAASASWDAWPSSGGGGGRGGAGGGIIWPGKPARAGEAGGAGGCGQFTVCLLSESDEWTTSSIHFEWTPPTIIGPRRCRQSRAFRQRGRPMGASRT